MKIIFLDHDSVICLARQWGSRFNKMKEYESVNGRTPDQKLPVHFRFDDFDKKAVRVLNNILSLTDAEIVVSSDWRLHATLEELQEFYLAQGICKAPIAVTPHLRDFDFEMSERISRTMNLEAGRTCEIRRWLQENSIENWIVVDDLAMVDLGDRFIWTPLSREGIKQSGVFEKIVQRLNSNANTEQ